MKIAVFGKPGGGKSTLGLQIAAATKLPLYHSSYRFLRRSPGFWNSALKARLLALRPGKRVYVVRKQSDVGALLAELGSWSPNGEA